MLNKSWLLRTIISETERITQEDGRNSLSSDYFVAALLTVVSKIKREGLDHAVVGASAKRLTSLEVQKIDELLAPYKLDAEKTSWLIRQQSKALKTDSVLNGFLFSKTEFSADAQAVREQRMELGADIYLSLILSEPTDILKACVINASAGTIARSVARTAKSVPVQTQASGGAGGNSSDGEISSVSELLDFFDDDDEEELTPASAPVENTGLDTLLKTVDKAKSVQQKLLSVVYGQDHAVSAFVSGYFQAELLSLTREKRVRPRATFLFAGPPGVGKTFLAEQAAKVLGLPYRRFDMSEYCEKEANLQFAGSDKVYKNGHPGNVTSFVDDNKRCIILFDEVEKAHINVIHLFLQILDAGKIRDNFTDEEVSFADAILIFTTNAGKGLYEDPSIVKLSGVPRKSVLKALASDVNPETGAPLFPAAVCSRFASGNVLMFNHLEAHNLLEVVSREIDNHAKSFTKKTKIEISIDKNVPYAIMFSEGGKADARAIRGKAASFLYQELYELFRLISSESNGFKTENIKTVSVNVMLPDDEEIRPLFAERENEEVLIFTDGERAKTCKKLISKPVAHLAATVEEAKDVLAKNDISVIFIDAKCGLRNNRGGVLNVEDIDSEGRDFFNYVREYSGLPIYLLAGDKKEISQEEYLSFSNDGARGIVYVSGGKNYKLETAVRGVCNAARQQHNLLELAKANKAVTYQTAQQVSSDGEHAEILLYDFKLGLALDAEDNKNVLSNISKPNVHFDDVIGAEDAKDELKFFVEYLKNPSKFLRSGVRIPRGILLYGPPGTGKTLLAKAMAGESNVTFITAEGNQFLKKFVGEGPESVHALFNTARKYAPSILFVDEIDAIGKNRSSEEGTASSAAAVLTAFLTEMDGFNVKSDKPVFVLAATNFDLEGTSRSLDPALVRRFDNKILVDLPNKDERARYLKMKADAQPSMDISEDEIENIAVRSTGMSLADLESVIELALRNAIKSENLTVDDAVLENAFESFNSGEIKKWDPSELEKTARHEAGHALVCWMGGEVPSYLTIVARGNYGGYMQHGDTENMGSRTKKDLLARIRTSLGGRAAELVYYGEEGGLSTGASGDLQTATAFAERMICAYGMDEVIGLGTVDLNKAASTEYYAVIRERINSVLNEELKNAKDIIANNRAAVDRLVNELMRKNHMRGTEIDAILSSLIKK